MAGDPYYVAFQKESAGYSRLLPGLLESSRGLFVAIHNGEVVDKASERAALVDRIRAEYPREFVLIRQVTQREEPVASIDTPGELG